MTQPLDSVLLSSGTDKNFSNSATRKICEAYGCNRQATNQITMSVGSLGDVELNLCKSCVPKFNDSIVNENNNGKLTALGEQLTPTDRMANPNDNYSRPYL